MRIVLIPGGGRPLREWDGTNTTSYVYDTQNQLVRENNPAAGKTWTWVYDNAGNILSRNEYAYTTGTLGTPVDTVSYTYGDSSWGDLLTAYDGKPITYDTIGNPLTYDGWTFNWQHGRQLASMSKDGTTWTNTYDANGMRTKRTNGTTTYQYVYNGDLLTQITVGNYKHDITYDALGTPVAITINNYTYRYVTNAQGDVTGILDEDGNQVITYVYDAWGNVTKIGDDQIGDYNPLLYRGYVYDWETGLYYISSRYYDPEICRWINVDSQLNMDDDMLGSNLFAYCLNNPVNQVDPLGTASYRNSYTVHRDKNGKVLGYNVTTIVNVMWTKLTYKYYITANGVIQFDFDKNNYWSLLWRGGGRTLAEAMYKQAKAINKNFLYGRTIGGLNTELQGHWAAYKITGNIRAGVADMGALIKGKPGYDSNAWAWEGGNAAKIVCRIKIFNIWGFAKTIRDIMRYL